MHIVVCPKRRNENMAIKVVFAVALASLVGLSGIMNGMIYAEEPTTQSSETATQDQTR